VTATRAHGARAPQVVLDTNVVLSALLFPGHTSVLLRRAWQRGAFVPLVSAATAQELMRTLAYPKFRLDPSDQHELLGDYLPYASAVQVPLKLPEIPRCRDPFDIPFLHLADVGRAEAIVSGDRDLLSMAADWPVPILSPVDFLDHFRLR
jgi:putative PIN family toxin of toxin-antitoxin system